MSPGSYQSSWFWVSGVTIGLGVLCLLHLWRVSRVRADVMRRLAERDRIARDLLHTMSQDVQGLILKIDAVVKQMAPAEQARQALENTLDRADEILAESSTRVRSLLGTDSLGKMPSDVTGLRKNH